jgi:hypothetical protein
MNESIVSIEDSLKLLIQMYVNYLPFLEPARQYNVLIQKNCHVLAERGPNRIMISQG